MNCTAARELLLVADAAELAGRGRAELAVHVRDCQACRAAAAAILEAERQLGQALAAATPRRGVDQALELARRRAWRRRWAWRVAPLAAAALLAIVWLGRPARLEQQALSPTPPAVGSGIAVEAPPGRSVAVFRSDNPEIVVIWFF
jgi:hypothetical protein